MEQGVEEEGRSVKKGNDRVMCSQEAHHTTSGRKRPGGHHAELSEAADAAAERTKSEKRPTILACDSNLA